jgi:hypothetical protein
VKLSILILILYLTAQAQPMLPPLPMKSLAKPVRNFAVTLAWSSSADTNVTGYNIYHGGVSRIYTNNVNVGTPLTCTVSNLLRGSTYFFAATAYNALGMESDYSNETSYRVPVPPVPPRVITITVISGLEQIEVSGRRSEVGPTSDRQPLTSALWTNTLTLTNPPGSAAFFRGTLAPVQVKLENL